jgi:FkbM family methyltransferase
MIRIFLDVGANRGQTLKYVVQHVEFDRIVCFEPVPSCCKILREKYSDPRIIINEFGLWNQNCKKFIFSAGSPGGSLFDDKDGIDVRRHKKCKFIRASDYFRENISINDVVFLKLNCEGAECDIVSDLLDSGEMDKVDYLAIDYDVRKVPSQRHKEKETKRRLRKCKTVITELHGAYYEEDKNSTGKPSKEMHNYRIERWIQSCK